MTELKDSPRVYGRRALQRVGRSIWVLVGVAIWIPILIELALFDELSGASRKMGIFCLFVLPAMAVASEVAMLLSIWRPAILANWVDDARWMDWVTKGLNWWLFSTIIILAGAAVYDKLEAYLACAVWAAFGITAREVWDVAVNRALTVVPDEDEAKETS